MSGDEEEGETPTEGDREGVKQMGNKAKIEREEAEAEKMKTGHRQSKPPPPFSHTSSSSPTVSQGSSSHSVATFQGRLLIGKLSAHVDTALP